MPGPLRYSTDHQSSARSITIYVPRGKYGHRGHNALILQHENERSFSGKGKSVNDFRHILHIRRIWRMSKGFEILILRTPPPNGVSVDEISRYQVSDPTGSSF